MYAAPITPIRAAQEVAKPADTRSYTLNENAAWAHHRWTLRCHGRGVCTLGEGVPNWFDDRDRAECAGRTWVLTGVAPADQRVPA